MGSRVDTARKAFRKKNLELSKKAHTKKAIHEEEHKKEKGQYIGDLVYGAVDGIVTTFAVVSGVEGAKLSPTIVVILGLANLLGDGISMALGNYLSTKSELDYIENERKREEWEIENLPEGEKEEIRAIFKKKGFKGKDLDRAVEIITSNKEVWINTMMLEELKLITEDKTPVASGIATFIAFVVAGIVPIIPFIIALFNDSFLPLSFPLSIIMTVLVLFGVGALRTLITGIHWLRSGLEMLFVGGLAASVAYLVGYGLRALGI